MGHYQRLGTVALEDVLPAIVRRLENPQVNSKFLDLLGAQVRISGLRLRTFAERPLCCSNPNCQSVPTHFAVERDKGDPEDSPTTRPYHLNMYGRNEHGHEVLFTHDHTLARGLGGADDIENTTTMCLPCNQKKSRLEGALANRLHNKQRGLVPHAPPSDRKIERQRAMFEREREYLGLEPDRFRAYCNEQGLIWRQGQPLENRGTQDPRRRMAQVLELSLEGFLFLRHTHNERMQSIFAANKEEPVVVAVPRRQQLG